MAMPEKAVEVVMEMARRVVLEVGDEDVVEVMAVQAEEAVKDGRGLRWWVEAPSWSACTRQAQSRGSPSS